MPPTFKDYGDALAFLKWAKEDLTNPDPEAPFVASGRDQVLAKYGSIFRDHADTLTEKQMGEFLDFSENHHWTGLHRQKTAICSDMAAVRKAVGILVDKPSGDDNVASRFDRADALVKGFGEGIITPILFVSFPETYAVWNSKSEFALQALGLWPMLERRMTDGEKYVRINATIYYARKNLSELGEEVDLWTIDHYWHAIKVMSEDGRFDRLVHSWQSQNP